MDENVMMWVKKKLYLLFLQLFLPPLSDEAKHGVRENRCIIKKIEIQT